MWRFLFALWVSGAMLSAADVKVDHVTVAGHDLKSMTALFQAAGFPVEYGGRHSNGITEMALASFPDGSYLELIAPRPGADTARHEWGRFMAGDAGPCAWAIVTTDLNRELDRLQSAGIEARNVSSGRKRPDGVELKWETAAVGPAPQGSLFPFLIRDATPRELRVYPQGQPTDPDVAGVAAVVVAVRDLERAVGKYRSAFGLGAPVYVSDKVLGARLAVFPRSPVVLASAGSSGGWLAQRIGDFGEAPCALVFASDKPFATTAKSKWGQREVRWIDPARLNGARVGVVSNGTRRSVH